MTLADIAELLLNVTTIVGLALDIPVAIVVLVEALQKPRLWGLILFAYVLVGIAVIVAITIWSVANRAAGYPVPADAVQLIGRIALLYLAMFAPLFIWVRRSGRFRDAGS